METYRILGQNIKSNSFRIFTAFNELYDWLEDPPVDKDKPAYIVFWSRYLQKALTDPDQSMPELCRHDLLHVLFNLLEHYKVDYTTEDALVVFKNDPRLWEDFINFSEKED